MLRLKNAGKLFSAHIAAYTSPIQLVELTWNLPWAMTAIGSFSFQNNSVQLEFLPLTS